MSRNEYENPFLDIGYASPDDETLRVVAGISHVATPCLVEQLPFGHSPAGESETLSDVSADVRLPTIPGLKVQ